MKTKNRTSKVTSSVTTTQKQSDPMGLSDPLWTKHGENDVNYQRQTQLTWWTLLGGIAVGALLTQLESLLSGIKAGQWYYIFYFIATCFMLINNFVAQAWGAMMIRCPIQIEPAIYTFFATLSLSISALNITHPAAWTASIAFFVFFSTLTNSYYYRHNAMLKDVVKNAQKTVYMFELFVIIAIGASIFLYLNSTAWAVLVVGIISLILSLLSLYSQHATMQIERKRYGID
jgi:hypothetical protein